jgi:hypothetical protein
MNRVDDSLGIINGNFVMLEIIQSPFLASDNHSDK